MMNRRRSNLLSFILIFIFILSQNPTESFLRQSDLLTKFLDETIKTGYFKFTKENSSHYQLFANNAIFHLNKNFLNFSKIQFTSLRYYYEQFSITYGGSISIFRENEALFWEHPDFNPELKNVKDQEDIQYKAEKIIDWDQIQGIDTIVSPNKESVLVFYSMRNRIDERRVWIATKRREDDFYDFTEFIWKSLSKTENEFIKVFANNIESEFYILYTDQLNPKVHLKKESKLLVPESVDLPYIGVFNSKDLVQDRIFQFPVLCAENNKIKLNKDSLYYHIVDAFQDQNELGIGFYFLIQNLKNEIICYLNEKSFEINVKPNEKYCEDPKRQFGKDSLYKVICTPNDLDGNSIIHKDESNKYSRILAKSIIDDIGDTKTTIIFLLDKRNRLEVFSLKKNLKKNKPDKKCFEGIFNLLNQKTSKILDIYLDSPNDLLILITHSYIQKIPIQAFCTKNSFSSCKTASACHMGASISPICNDSKYKNRECIDINNEPLSKEKMQSDEFLCDQESNDMCLVSNTENLILKDDYGFCNEASCLCTFTTCLKEKCNSDYHEKLACPLDKSLMQLSSFEVTLQAEPLPTIVISTFVTLFIITFILLTFYCCFSISQGSKKNLALTDLSTIDLSKLDVKEDIKY